MKVSPVFEQLHLVWEWETQYLTQGNGGKPDKNYQDGSQARFTRATSSVSLHTVLVFHMEDFKHGAT